MVIWGVFGGFSVVLIVWGVSVYEREVGSGVIIYLIDIYDYYLYARGIGKRLSFRV